MNFYKSMLVKHSLTIWGIVLALIVNFGNCDKQEMQVSERFTLGLEVRGDFVILDTLVQTSGWVGVGLSSNGVMDGADLCIAAINEDGRHYLNDYFGVGHTPTPDRNGGLDWFMAGYTENGTYTNAKFMRRLVTNDPDDIEIKNETINVLWSFGESDDVTVKHAERGSVSINLFDTIEQ